VVYSDGRVDASPGTSLDPPALAAALRGAGAAPEMVDRLGSLPEPSGPPPDCLTVVVLRCLGAP
jgi:hypothetical protein